MYKIFIAEDDEVIAQIVKKHLEAWGMQVMCVSDFRNVAAQFAAFSPHLVLMDISLPFFSGYHWCGEIRKISKVPVIFISSASDNMNIIMAVSMGADDFIAKPFDLDVLGAKVRAMLRRTYDFTSPVDLLEHSGIILSLSDMSVSFGDKKSELSRNEFRILQVLFENAGRVVSRDALMQKLWETDSFVDENTLTVNMSRLRRKLAEIGAENLITTKKGTGYMVE